MYFVDCIETMHKVVTFAGISAASLIAIGSYGYRSGKIVYSVFINSRGKVKQLEINEDDIPDRFKCAITGKVMIEPVVCP
jgi:hypothetical protein